MPVQSARSESIRKLFDVVKSSQSQLRDQIGGMLEDVENEFRDRINEVQGKIGSLQERLVGIKSDLAKSPSSVGKLRRERDRIRSDLGFCEKRLAELRREQSLKLHHSLSTLRDSQANLVDALERLRKEIDETATVDRAAFEGWNREWEALHAPHAEFADRCVVVFVGSTGRENVASLTAASKLIKLFSFAGFSFRQMRLVSDVMGLQQGHSKLFVFEGELRTGLGEEGEVLDLRDVLSRCTVHVPSNSSLADVLQDVASEGFKRVFLLYIDHGSRTRLGGPFEPSEGISEGVLKAALKVLAMSFEFGAAIFYACCSGVVLTSAVNSALAEGALRGDSPVVFLASSGVAEDAQTNFSSQLVRDGKGNVNVLDEEFCRNFVHFLLYGDLSIDFDALRELLNDLRRQGIRPCYEVCVVFRGARVRLDALLAAPPQRFCSEIQVRKEPREFRDAWNGAELTDVDGNGLSDLEVAILGNLRSSEVMVKGRLPGFHGLLELGVSAKADERGIDLREVYAGRKAALLERASKLHGILLEVYGEPPIGYRRCLYRIAEVALELIGDSEALPEAVHLEDALSLVKGVAECLEGEEEEEEKGECVAQR